MKKYEYAIVKARKSTSTYNGEPINIEHLDYYFKGEKKYLGINIEKILELSEYGWRYIGRENNTYILERQKKFWDCNLLKKWKELRI